MWNSYRLGEIPPGYLFIENVWRLFPTGSYAHVYTHGSIPTKWVTKTYNNPISRITSFIFIIQVIPLLIYIIAIFLVFCEYTNKKMIIFSLLKPSSWLKLCCVENFKISTKSDKTTESEQKKNKNFSTKKLFCLLPVHSIKKYFSSLIWLTDILM